MQNALNDALDTIAAAHDLSGIGITRYYEGGGGDGPWMVVTLSWGGIGEPTSANCSGYGDNANAALNEALHAMNARRKPVAPVADLNAVALTEQVAA